MGEAITDSSSMKYRPTLFQYWAKRRRRLTNIEIVLADFTCAMT